MTTEKKIQKEKNKFDKWCDKQSYDYCRLQNNRCYYCSTEYFAKKIVKLKKKISEDDECNGYDGDGNPVKYGFR
jgi:hypothetical protein